MSELLKNNDKNNPDAKKWENLDLNMRAQRINDSIENRMLGNELENGLEQREHQMKEDIFSAKAAVLHSYANGGNPKDNESNAEQERFDEQQKAKENHEKYGENLTAETARRGFSKEYVALKSKFEKVRRAEEREKEMTTKESQKAYKKRLKDGIVMSAEDRKHLLEMDGMDTYQREEYGRKKHKEYMLIQEKKEAHPIKFRQLVRKNKLSIPKNWDDPNYSLDDIRHINSALILLDDSYK